MNRHRVFLGCPIASDAAVQIISWCQNELGELGVRLIPAANLHVTLIYFGDVDTATRDALSALTRQAHWPGLSVKLGALAGDRRAALTFALLVAQDAIEKLEDRLGRSSVTVPPGLSAEEHEAWAKALWNQDDPIYRMRVYVPDPENTKLVRRQSAGRPLQLHLTIGRLKSEVPVSVREKSAPEITLELDRLVLFESFLAPAGSHYVALAESHT